MFGGLNARQKHIFNWITVVIVMLYVTGWIGAIHDVIEQRREIARIGKEAEARVPEAKMPGVKAPVPAPPPPLPATQIATQIFQPQAPTTAYIDDAMLGFLNPLRGRSGKVYFTTVTPGAQIGRAHV